jgi:hypothetical protein
MSIALRISARELKAPERRETVGKVEWESQQEN